MTYANLIDGELAVDNRPDGGLGVVDFKVQP